MANLFTPEQLNIKPPPGGFREGGWYGGRQIWGGMFSDPGVINPLSTQVGAGQAVSEEVNRQSAAAQGVPYEQFTTFLQKEGQRAAQVKPAATPAPTPSGAGTAAAGVAGQPTGAGAFAPTAQPAIDLPKLYEQLYSSAGVKEKEAEYTKMEREYIEAKARVNDNPFLSEATRVGRVAKLEQLFNERTANIKGEIATKKADVETQLNLQLKQFDINSQQARDALSQFNTLLQLGALDSASGEDIANITRATGISSNMIQSAIQANKAKNVKTQVIQSTNDAGVVTVSVINSETGAIVKQTSLGAIGNKQEGRQPTETEKKAYYQNALRTDAASGTTLQQIFKIYSGILDPNEILVLYNANSSWGQATESYKELEKYGVKAPTGYNPLTEELTKQ